MEIKRMWFNYHKQGQQSCINLEPSPMGVGGHNVVLEVPRTMDMKLGVRRLFRERGARAYQTVLGHEDSEERCGQSHAPRPRCR